MKGRTAVIATHRVPILQLADRTMILANGRMIVDGPRDQVLAHLRGAQCGIGKGSDGKFRGGTGPAPHRAPGPAHWSSWPTHRRPKRPPMRVTIS